MKAITLRQPFASLITAGLKTYETRSWKTNHRGTLAIHAGLQADPLPDALRRRLENHPNYGRDIFTILRGGYPKGAIIAIVEITDCICMDDLMIVKLPIMEFECGFWKSGRYAWKLENIRVLPEPYPIKGQQGIWNISDKILSLVEGVNPL